MSEDRLNRAVGDLRAAIRCLMVNSKQDPIKSLRHTLDAFTHAQDATRLIHEEAKQLHLLVIREVENATKRSTDHVLE